MGIERARRGPSLSHLLLVRDFDFGGKCVCSSVAWSLRARGFIIWV